MRKYSNNSVFQYVLIACLGIALLLGQTAELHMHVQHSDVSSESIADNNFSVAHIIDVHVSSSQHHTAHDKHHQDDFQDHHNNADIDIGSDGVLNILKVLSSMMFLLLVISFVLFVPLLQRIRKTDISQTSSPTKYYLLHAPSRAPPIL